MHSALLNENSVGVKTMGLLLRWSSLVLTATLLTVAGLRAQTNAIQLRNGSASTTLYPATNNVVIQIPDAPDGSSVLYLNASASAPSSGGGGGLLYGTTTTQNTLKISNTVDNPYLFNLSYSGASDAANAANALGGVISSVATVDGYGATGLSITATGRTSGNATGLTLSASSGTGRADALIIASGRLRLNGTTNFATLRAATLAGSYEYIWPADTPVSGDMMKVASISGSNITLEWGTPTSLISAGSSVNSTLIWDGSSWVENTGVTSNGTNLNVSGGRVTSQTLTVSNTSNQIILGTTRTTTINSTQPSSSRTYTIPDAGGNAEFVMTAGSQTITGNKTFTGQVTANLKVTSINSDATTEPAHTHNATATDGIIIITATDASVTVNLPAAAGNTGVELTIIHAAEATTHTIEVVGVRWFNGSWTSANFTMTDGDAVTVISDGTNWYIRNANLN